ncbi:DMT family transporter [Pseudonocardia petroleophila]|uniref:DMT family transporter n=1 Tax=Pseudonocardia petroleophila TaxID=37331 RepID=A0A7G7MIC8_9PSEU|nr:DMT family transporter [Pseudonocardia petroleophila]QNG52539.1 DMT family transporter [Pseudonocardia petroleophila]
MRTTGLIATLALLWGSGFFWIALALDGFTPVQITFARLALGALVLVPIVLWRRLPRPAGRTMWLHLTVSALVGNAIPYTLFAVAEQTVPSSLAGVINATTPLWTLLLAVATRSDSRLTSRRAAGVALGFVGVLVVFEPWNGVAGGTATGLFACIGAAASYGIAYIYQARFLTNRGLSPLTLTAAQLLIAAALLALALPFSGALHSPGPLAIVAVLILGIIGTGVALIINFQLIATEGATAASVVTYLVPAVALLLGVLVLSEPASLALPIGGVLILTGVAITRARSRPARPSP